MQHSQLTPQAMLRNMRDSVTPQITKTKTKTIAVPEYYLSLEGVKLDSLDGSEDSSTAVND